MDIIQGGGCSSGMFEGARAVADLRGSGRLARVEFSLNDSWS